MSTAPETSTEPARPGSSSTRPSSAVASSTGAVRLVDVAKVYNEEITAVSGISLDIAAGEFVSLLGPSGCGKTTLLRMLAGFERPTTGDILLDGVSIIDVPPERRPVNTVFQSYALFPHMTVAQNVAFGLRQRKVAKGEIGQRVADALDLVQMRRFNDRKPDMLSGGQQQRVALARALANRPDVLLLDEPMSALDRKLRENMQVELKLLQRELGTTFIFVTHDQEEALAMSDRIVVMSEGSIAQVGDGREIYADPTNRFVADFIGKQNFIPATGVTSDGKIITVDGDITVADPPERIGDDAVVAIRPEQIWLTDDEDDPYTNSIPGVASGISFLGDSTQVVVTTPADTEILVRGATRNFPPLTEGQDVVCRFSVADAKVYDR